MSLFPLKSTHAPVKAYYAALAQFNKHGHTTEGNTRSAFADLLKKCCSHYGWHLVEEYQFKGTGKQPLRADGALVDELTLVHGIWEAKDSDDDLEREVKAKFAKGYPLTNILFQSPTRAILYQGSRKPFDGPIDTPEALIEVLTLFFEHRQEHEVDWEEAVFKFAEKIPDLARGVTEILEKEDKKNPAFRQNFQSFAELCRQSINPDLTDDAIRKMLVQHLLTARIFIRVFKNEEFLRRNVIAAEIEKVIDSITSRYFSRNEFLKPLDRFYTAIERAAESQQGYTEKQHFLNAVYEKFFQRFDTKQADTHGIVYTPQPIVDFMVRSVEEILQQEFGKSLSDSGVHILDPFTGTGNFITRIMQQIKRSALPQKYAEELHCNEIMLLPYYIASMNIEHAYMERAGEYKPFEGICLVDTFELSEARQHSLFTTENTERVKKQKEAPIRVVIGNPPYNAWQQDSNDGNANRKYPALDSKVKESYIRKSSATLTTSLWDPYVKAFRWASERIKDHGVVCYVSNSSYIEQRAFDGMRKDLHSEFQRIYVLDLGGNVRRNPKLSGTTHNVFGIQVGVSITLLVRKPELTDHVIHYARMPVLWRRAQKYDQLTRWQELPSVEWTTIYPDARGGWLTGGENAEFEGLTPLKGDKRDGSIFRLSSNGPKSNDDPHIVNFSRAVIEENAKSMVEAYEAERALAQATEQRAQGKHVIKVEAGTLKWIRRTRRSLAAGTVAELDIDDIRLTAHRPYTASWRYLSRIFNEDLYYAKRIAPSYGSHNPTISVSQPAPSREAFCLATGMVADHHLTGDSQCFPFYIYDEDRLNRRENITDWALVEFRTHCSDKKITKWDIFHATYAVLHHPEYRTRYAANLKRELPRIPFPSDFHAFAASGKRLMELHIDYEKQTPYKLEEIEHPKAEVTFRVERMKLSKDKSELRYNDFLTLRGIPAATFDYRLGNRSALEWVIDQYRVSTDQRSGIANDPNREDDPQYILRLIGQVITVSVETQQIIAALPSLNLGA